MKRKFNTLPPQALLHEMLDYDPATGVFRWKAGRIHGGEIAGCVRREDGRRLIPVRNIYYTAHRLAWVYVYGSLKGDLDHINLNRGDNRIANLRLAGPSQNGANRGLFKNNTSGFKGVTKRKNGLFEASIYTRGKTYYLGQYTTGAEAHAAYMEAASRIFGEFARAA